MLPLYLLLIIALLGIIVLFTYQFFRLRAGKVERLHNVTIKDVVIPVFDLIKAWFLILLERLRQFLAPFLILFYKAILSSLHTLTVKASSGLQHTARLIKGKEMHIHHKYK